MVVFNVSGSWYRIRGMRFKYKKKRFKDFGKVVVGFGSLGGYFCGYIERRGRGVWL